MSKKLFHDPEHWHERAEDARRLAAQIIDPISRRTMLEIAERYEALARRAAQRLREVAPAGDQNLPAGETHTERGGHSAG